MSYNEYFIGDPASQMDDWIHQNEIDNCAVAAETSLINQFLEEGITIDDATYISRSNGWYEPGEGTMMDEIGNLMEIHGVPNHSVINASFEQLVAELQNGNGVIVGVNSSELWDNGILNNIKEFFYEVFGLDIADFNPADHAVVFTGIDVSDPENPMAILNDSGTPNGAAVRYPLDQFADAWSNSGFYYTATDMPIPNQPSPTDMGIDLGDILGFGTTLFTGDPYIGELVDISVDTITEADWEQLLA
jgi:hypothetical protein